jgi:hypothetical protein
MSHVPLLSRQSVPKLQPPRRAPQALLLCTVTIVVLLLLPHSAYDALSWNATRAHDDPPPAVNRIMQAATQHQFVEDNLFQDLLATVSYLAKRELEQR